ncbi:MAG: HAMP domain-containing protein [Myxococcales bacterium]|nr:HAMP domain-containing protein [Myxococcales bacterium]
MGGPLIERILPRTVQGTILLGLLLMLGIDLALEVVTHRRTVREGREEAVQANVELARATAAAFQSFVGDVLHQCRAIALHFSTAVPTEAAIEHLSQMTSEMPAVRYFGYADLEGQVAAAGPAGDPEVLRHLTDAPYFRAIREGAEWVVGDATPGRGPYEASFVIARAARGRQGELIGVVFAMIDPDALVSLLAPRAGGAAVALIDRNGRGVVRAPTLLLSWAQRDWVGRQPETARALRGELVTGTLASPVDGAPRVAALAPISPLGWVAVASRPESEVLAAVRREIATEVGLAGVLAVLGLGLAFLLSRRVTVPLSKLQAGAGQLGSGSLKARVEPRGPSELASLANAFNAMAGRLADRERELSEEVARSGAAAAEAKRQANLLQVVLDNLPEGIFLSDVKGRLLVANPTARQLVGRELSASVSMDEQAVALGMRKPDGTPYRAEELPISRALRGEQVQRQEVVIQQPGGPEVTVMVNCAPFTRDGEIEGAVALFQDISPLKEAERLREEFIHLISHDLRNPLNVVLGHARLLERRALPEREEKSARAIGAAALRMSKMVDDLVESARLEAGKLSLERRPTSLAELVQRHFSALLSEEQRRVRVECEAEAMVLADPDRLERVLSNLLSNALKYSTGEVVVRVRRQGDEVDVTVADRGPGIPPEQQAHLFERYYRGEARHREGLGLGLYISRMLVLAHGGRIWVQSRPGEGSTFGFELPALAPLEPRAPA